MDSPNVATWYVYFVLCMAGAAGAVVDWSVNQWVLTRNSGWWIITALGVSAGVALFVALLQMKHFPFGVAVVMSLVTQCLIGVAVDHFFYQEKYGSVIWAGILLGLASMVLMDVGTRDHKKQQQSSQTDLQEPQIHSFRNVS